MGFKSFPEVLAAKVAEHPDKVFAIDGEKSITYRQYFAAALSFAEYLRSKGIKKGDKAVVVAGQTIACLNTLMACYIIGAVTIPIERNSPRDHVDNMCKKFDASAVISSKVITDACIYIDMSLADVIGEKYIDEYELNDLPDFPNSNDVLSIMFTTGTTGMSKGVVLSVDSQVALAENLCSAIYESEDVVLSPLPLDHAYGIRRYQGVLLSGGTLVILGIPFMMQSFFDAIYRYDVSAVAMTSSHMAMILNFEEEKIAEAGKRLRLIEFGSTTTPKTIQEKLKSILPDTRLISTYGMTEAGAISTIDFHDVENENYCIGRPIVEGTMYIGDSEGVPLAPDSGESGRIHLTGRTVMSEYYGEPSLTSDVLNDGVIKTSDIGYYGRGGMIYYGGRADDVIITGAFKVAPQEIEDIAMQMPGIIECACVPVADSVLGNVPKLFVVMDESIEFSFKEVYAYLAARLDRTILPRYIEQIDTMPRTNNGKILRRSLKSM